MNITVCIMKRGFVLILVVLLLSINMVSALQVGYESVQRHVLPGQKAVFNLLLTNNEGKSLDITISSADLNWILDGDTKSYVLPADETKSIPVSFSPIGQSVKPGLYGIQVKVSTPLTTLEKILQMRFLSYNQLLDASFDNNIVDPKKSNILSLKVTNNYEVELNDLSLTLSSDHFVNGQIFSLGREESKVLDFVTNIPEDTIEGTYNARVLIEQGDNVLVDKDVQYVVTKHDNVKELSIETGGFLVSGSEITINNEGNSPVVRTYSKQFSSIEYRLASFNPAPYDAQKNDDGYEVIWQYSLMPGEDYTINYEVSYRLVLLFLIILVVLVVLWYVFRKKNPVVLEKKILAMHEAGSGNVHIVKVLLNIRNRGAISVSNVRVMDNVPRTIKTPASFGSLKPSSVKSSPEGTIILWDIPFIKGGSEILISYRLEGKIQVIGSVGLPAAKCKYKLFGRQVVAVSNFASLKNKK